ncbi:MAG: hypothetical protein ACE5JP_00500 [Candidatus Bipolaricaulia bacterium]
MSRMKRIYHRFRGRQVLYQYYTNVHYRTPESCLRYHGRIYTSMDTNLPEECLRYGEHLEFPVRELDYYQAMADRMKRIAEDELRRRRLFREASDILSDRTEAAVELLKEATRIETYVGEVEGLVWGHRERLAEDPQLARTLYKLFIRAYRNKFAKPKYERWPERMRFERERYGVQRLNALFEFEIESGEAGNE